MVQITVRGLEPEIEKEIRGKAQKSGKSLNRVILDMISNNTGTKKTEKKPPAASLKKLAGGWDEQEYLEFMASIKSCEQIDEEMWK